MRDVSPDKGLSYLSELWNAMLWRMDSCQDYTAVYWWKTTMKSKIKRAWVQNTWKPTDQNETRSSCRCFVMWFLFHIQEVYQYQNTSGVITWIISRNERISGESQDWLRPICIFSLCWILDLLFQMACCHVTGFMVCRQHSHLKQHYHPQQSTGNGICFHLWPQSNRTRFVIVMRIFLFWHSVCVL